MTPRERKWVIELQLSNGRFRDIKENIKNKVFENHAKRSKFLFSLAFRQKCTFLCILVDFGAETNIRVSHHAHSMPCAAALYQRHLSYVDYVSTSIDYMNPPSFCLLIMLDIGRIIVNKCSEFVTEKQKTPEIV